jgi:amino acid adenylation domain-containing protein
MRLPEIVEAQVARTPERIAVKFEGAALTYRELNTRANRLAHYLIGRHVGPEDLIAVAIPRSVELVVALLGVLKTGAAYVPIDPEYPARRIALILDDAAPTALLVTTGPRLPAEDRARIRLDDAATAEAIGRCPAADPADDDRNGFFSPRSPAYVIYTSGSTGTPKGVVVEHESVVGYLGWTTRTYPGAQGVSLLPTSPAFDLTVTGLYTTLATGGCVHLVAMPAYHPADLAELRRSPCTFLKITPSHLPILTGLPPELSPEIDLLIGGEALHGTTVEEWRQRHPDATVYNVYGPTEATVNCAEYRIEPGAHVGAGPIPIGRPQAGRHLHVLDPDLRPVPPGETGELYIGGTGLARGYLGRPAMTAERFLPDPTGPAGARMYRTGDRVRRREDGCLVFVGRVDGQVKLRGFRIEPGEVEVALAGRPEIAHVACVVRGEQADAELVAYVVPHPGQVVDPSSLRRYAGEILPSHMVPAAVVVLDELPRTPNGKLARDVLRDRVVHRRTSGRPHSHP